MYYIDLQRLTLLIKNFIEYFKLIPFLFMKLHFKETTMSLMMMIASKFWKTKAATLNTWINLQLELV